MLFKKPKRIVPPRRRSEDETPFRLYQIADGTEAKPLERDRFVSPIFGKHVKDDVVIPIMSTNKRDLDKLDSFRKTPRLTKEELIAKYGTAYPEFDLIRGKNLNEAMASQEKRRSARIIHRTPDETIHEDETDKKMPHDEPLEETIHHKPKEEVTKPQDPKVDQEPTETVEPQEEIFNDEPIEVDEGFVRSDLEATKDYQLPPFDLFTTPQEAKPDLTESIEKNINTLNKTFEEFSIGAKVHKHTQGPTVTRYEIALDSGVNVRKITGIADNLKMSLEAREIRIEAPIPGKSTVGIEVPNATMQTVHFIDIIESSKFVNAAQPLTVALGLDIDGKAVFSSIKSMPHGLVAGATGSGKSVCINTILMSLLVKYTPSELKLILIDPKMVELSHYNDLPHLITPVITDAKAATGALRWVVDEMDRRFNIFSDEHVRDIDSYNEKKASDNVYMPYIVIVVDELADLIMVSSQHVEDAIKRITQKARACGIHLIIATQRPSTDVVKGTIKSNIPTRIAFSVSSYVDSQTIIDSSGAEKLLGRGDMLYASNGQGKIRVQGAFVPDKDIETITAFIRDQMPPTYRFTQDMLVKSIAKTLERDELFETVARFVVEAQEASINKISKNFNIGFNRAQSIVQSLEDANIVSENLGSKPRDVLIEKEDLDALLKKIR